MKKPRRKKSASSKACPAPPPPRPSPAEVSVILDGHFANLVRRVNDGRVLSATELKMLRSIEGGGEAGDEAFAANKAELARALDVSRRTIARASKDPGSPDPRSDGRHDIGEWRAFLATRGTLDAPDELSLRVRNLLLHNRLLEHRIEIIAGRYVPVADVRNWGGQLGAAIRKVVTGIHCMAPSLAGQSVSEIDRTLRGIEDEVLQQLHGLDRSMAQCKEAPDARGAKKVTGKA